MAILTFVSAISGLNGATVNIGNGVLFDIEAALIAGGGVITVDTSSNPVLAQALAQSPAVMLSGSTPGTPVVPKTLAPVEAYIGSPMIGDILVRGGDGQFAPSQTLPSQISAPTTATPFAHLAFSKGDANVPVGLRGHLVADNASNGTTDQQINFYNFEPLSDANVLDVVPVFNNPLAIVGWAGGDVDAPNPIQISYSVLLPDNTKIPVLFNGGQRQVTLGGQFSPYAIPDAPTNIGAQVAANDEFNNPLPVSGYWGITYVTCPTPSRVDAGCSATSGNPVITDSAMAAGDYGRVITGTGIPGTSNLLTYIGPSSIVGTSIRMSSDPTKQVDVNATVTTSGTLSVTVKSIIPFNRGAFAHNDAASAAGAADLTLPTSATIPSGGAYSFYYGPASILAKSSSKDILTCYTDSIFDGYSEDFHSPYFGPLARTAMNIRMPFVKGSKGGETIGTISTPIGRRYRSVWMEGGTLCVVGEGTNDGQLANAGGVTTMTTRYQTMGNYVTGTNTNGVRALLATIPPRTTSTDSWVTTANQTPVAGSQIAPLASMNQAIRLIGTPTVAAGLSMYYGYIGLCEVLTSALDSGLWMNNAGVAITADGVHPNDAYMRNQVLGVCTTAINAAKHT